MDWKVCDRIEVWVKDECKVYSEKWYFQYNKNSFYENEKLTVIYPKYKFEPYGLFIMDVEDEPFISFIPYHELIHSEIVPIK